MDAKQACEKLRAMLKTVPPSVTSGSYQKSIAYKVAVDKANKALRTPNSLAKLLDAHNTLAAFY